MIIDAFAGPGIYRCHDHPHCGHGKYCGTSYLSGGQSGSPILALDTLLQHSHFKQFQKDIHFYFIESDATRFGQLHHELYNHNLSTQIYGEQGYCIRNHIPDNVHVSLQNRQFSVVADELTSNGLLVDSAVLLFVDSFWLERVPDVKAEQCVIECRYR